MLMQTQGLFFLHIWILLLSFLLMHKTFVIKFVNIDYRHHTGKMVLLTNIDVIIWSS